MAEGKGKETVRRWKESSGTMSCEEDQTNRIKCIHTALNCDRALYKSRQREEKYKVTKYGNEADDIRTSWPPQKGGPQMSILQRNRTRSSLITWLLGHRFQHPISNLAYLVCLPFADC